MMGQGFMGGIDPRQLMMQMQMAKQGAAGGTPFNAQAGMGQGMGMRSPNAPMPSAPPAQQPQSPMQGMNMQMLMEALKKRQPPMQNAAQVNAVNTGAMTADPMAQGAAQSADMQGGGGLLGLLAGLFR